MLTILAHNIVKAADNHFPMFLNALRWILPKADKMRERSYLTSKVCELDKLT